VTAARVYVARIAGLPVFDPNGDQVGRVRDVVARPRELGAPHVVGLVAELALRLERPDLAVSAERTKDAAPSDPRIRSPFKEVGIMGTIFGLVLRWFSNIVVGAGVPSSVQVVEVEVDTWLGHVRVLNVHTGIAVGKIAAPALARSQAAGSVIQGIGYALYEARETDTSSGHVLTSNMED